MLAHSLRSTLSIQRALARTPTRLVRGVSLSARPASHILRTQLARNTVVPLVTSRALCNCASNSIFHSTADIASGASMCTGGGSDVTTGGAEGVTTVPGKVRDAYRLPDEGEHGSGWPMRLSG